MAESNIVEAVGTASVATGGRSAFRAKRIEQAMAQAVKDCLARGVPLEDSVTIRQAMMDARDAVKAEG